MMLRSPSTLSAFNKMTQKLANPIALGKDERQLFLWKKFGVGG
jgi:hypothetical protein